MPGFSAHPPPVTLETPHSPLQLVSKALISHRHPNGLIIQSCDGLNDIYVPQSLSIFPSPYFPYFLDKEPPPQDKTCNRLVGFEPPKPFGRFLDPPWKKNSHFNSLFCNDCQGLTTHGIPVGTHSLPILTQLERK